MAQAPAISIQLDTASARRKLRRLLSLAREANAELANLDDQLAALEARAGELAEYGIKLEVSNV